MKFEKFRKLPVVVEAATLTEKYVIQTREGEIVGYPGDKLIRGVENELYPCGKEIFAKTYEPAMSTLLATAIEKGDTAVYNTLSQLRRDFVDPMELDVGVRVPADAPRVRATGQIYGAHFAGGSGFGMGYLVDGFDCIRLTLRKTYVDYATSAAFEELVNGDWVTIGGVVYRLPESRGLKLLILSISESQRP